jgi:hypothetical protein
MPSSPTTSTHLRSRRNQSYNCLFGFNLDTNTISTTLFCKPRATRIPLSFHPHSPARHSFTRCTTHDSPFPRYLLLVIQLLIQQIQLRSWISSLLPALRSPISLDIWCFRCYDRVIPCLIMYKSSHILVPFVVFSLLELCPLLHEV